MTGQVWVPGSEKVWALGDPDAPLLRFNGTDEFGVEWIIADPAGWYRSPPAEVALEDRPTDGAWFGRGAYKSRVLEVVGAFRVCGLPPAGFGSYDEALEHATDRLQDCLHPRVDTLFSVTERIPKQVTVRPSDTVAVDPVRGQRRARRFSFVLTAADPFKYAAGAAGLEVVELGLRNPADDAGVAHDLEHPLDYGGGDPEAAPDRALVTNVGQTEARPVLTVTGPVPSPTLVNVTTGELFTLDRDLAVGETAVIDTDLETVRVNGRSLRGAKAPRSRFWRLARGPNDVRFIAGSYSPTARARIEFRPRWK